MSALRLSLRRWIVVLLAVCAFTSTALTRARAVAPDAIARQVLPKMVKIYGAGGLQGLEAYQSGFLFTAEGHLLTAWSTVLDTDYITVILDDGRKYQGELVGYDPRMEIAVLKIDGVDLPHFSLHEGVQARSGTRVMAFSNLYGVATGDEPASLQMGIISSRTTLQARRGVYETPYRGPVYVIDAMTNNPGAAGGALTDTKGRLLGLLGKELRNAENNIWLNFALPTDQLLPAVEDILAGNTRPLSQEEGARPAADPLRLSLLGITLVPDVLIKTPPFIDSIARDSVAEKAGLKPDDLILFLNNRIVSSCRTLEEEMRLVDRADSVRLTVQRGQELLDVTLQAE